MKDVFLSYAHQDLNRVKRIVAACEARGWTVFWDRTIPAGKTWREVIGKALDEARCVVVVWSSASIKSRWVQEEADEGRERGILIPVLLDDVKPPMGFRDLQATSFADTNALNEALTLVVDGIAALLDTSSLIADGVAIHAANVSEAEATKAQTDRKGEARGAGRARAAEEARKQSEAKKAMEEARRVVSEKSFNEARSVAQFTKPPDPTEHKVSSEAKKSSIGRSILKSCFIGWAIGAGMYAIATINEPYTTPESGMYIFLALAVAVVNFIRLEAPWTK
jgi:hypothetical protein